MTATGVLLLSPSSLVHPKPQPHRFITTHLTATRSGAFVAFRARVVIFFFFRDFRHLSCGYIFQESVLITQLCSTLCDHMNCSPLGSSVHGGCSRQDYCSGLPCPPPGDLLDPGIKPGSALCLLHRRWILYPLSHQGSYLSGEKCQEIETGWAF